MQEVRLLHEKLDTGSGTTDNIYELTETISRIKKKGHHLRHSDQHDRNSLGVNLTSLGLAQPVK